MRKLGIFQGISFGKWNFRLLTLFLGRNYWNGVLWNLSSNPVYIVVWNFMDLTTVILNSGSVPNDLWWNQYYELSCSFILWKDLLERLLWFVCPYYSPLFFQEILMDLATVNQLDELLLGNTRIIVEPQLWLEKWIPLFMWILNYSWNSILWYFVVSFFQKERFVEFTTVKFFYPLIERISGTVSMASDGIRYADDPTLFALLWIKKARNKMSCQRGTIFLRTGRKNKEEKKNFLSFANWEMMKIIFFLEKLSSIRFAMFQ